MVRQKYNWFGIFLLFLLAVGCGESGGDDSPACSDWMDTNETMPFDPEWTGQATMGDGATTQNVTITFKMAGPIRRPTSGPSSCSDDRFIPLSWQVEVENEITVEVVEDVFWDTRFDWISSDGANRTSETTDVLNEGFATWPSSCFNDAELETDLYIEFSNPSFLESEIAWIQGSGCESATITIESGEKPF